MRIVERLLNLLPEADEEIAEAFTERYTDRFTVHTVTVPAHPDT